MGQLLKQLRPYVIGIIIILGVLFVRANAELALPEYMAKIVNVGIQQKGIETSIPEVIRESEFQKINLFLSAEDKDLVEKFYQKIEVGSNNQLEEKYPLLKEESLYQLQKVGKDDKNKLETILAKPMTLVLGISEGGLPGMENLGGVDPFLMIAGMNEQQKEEMMAKIEEELLKIPESMLLQSAALYIDKEYGIIGVDVSKMQSSFILNSGAQMLVIAFIGMIASIIVGYLAARISTGFSRNVRKALFEKVESFSNVEFDKFGTSSLITRTTNDIQQLQGLLGMLLQVVFFAPILGIGGIIKVLGTEQSMSWIIAFAVFLIFIVVLVLVIFAIPKFKLVQQFIDKLNLVVRENLTGLLVVRAFNTQKHEEKRFLKANHDLTQTNLFIARIMSSMMPLMMFIMNAVVVLIVWIGSQKIDQGLIQVGDMMAFIQYTMQIIMSFLMLTMVSIMLPRSAVSAMRIAEVLKTEAHIVNSKNPISFDQKKKGNIKFDKVSFKYPGAEDYVIHNVSFEALPGKTTAFIGSTGSGKSTLINLIPRFYDVTEGSIIVSGSDIREVDMKELRNKIGYVPQKGILFSGSIESNLSYGKEGATIDDIKEAARIAQATNFIEAKENGYEEHIAQGGGNVSGGQKQRLSIARAIVKNPEIYIFDDSFSALDFKTDATLRKELKKVTKEATTLIVAQRISTIMHADQIIVLDAGEMVGKGTHKELMNTCGVYQEIAYSQLTKEELEHE